MGDVTDDAKNSRRPDPDLDPVDDLGGIDVPDAPEDLDLPDAPSVERARKSPARDIYEVTGRARPQRIAPRESDTPAADDTRTTVFDPVPSQVEPSDDATRELHPDELHRAAGPAAAGPSGPPVGDDGDTATRVFDPVPADRPATDDAFATGSETAVLGAPVTAGAAGAVGGLSGYAAGAYGADGDVEETADLTDAVRQGRSGEYPDTADAPASPRGTLDLGLLLLRIIIGALLVLRGAQTLFGFGGDPGIDTLADRLAGFTAPDVLAVAVPVAEVVGGGLLLLGLLTPLGGAVAVASAGFMGLFELSLSSAGYWPYQLSQIVQIWGLLGLLGLVLVFTGPGRYSADVGRGWATRPRASAWLWAVIGLAGGAALWVLTGGGNPL